MHQARRWCRSHVGGAHSVQVKGGCRLRCRGLWSRRRFGRGVTTVSVLAAVGLFAVVAASTLVACRHHKKAQSGSKVSASRASEASFDPHVELLTQAAVGYGVVNLDGLVKHWPQLASWLLAGPKKSLVGWVKSQYGLDLTQARRVYVLFVQPENRHGVFSGLDFVAVVPLAAWEANCRHETEQVAGLSACRVVQEMFVVRRSRWAYLGSRPALTLVLGKHAGPAKRDNFALWIARAMKKLPGRLFVVGLRGEALSLKGMRHVLIDVGLDRRMQIVIKAKLGQDDAADKLGQNLREQIDRMARGLLAAQKVLVPGQEAVAKQASAILAAIRIDVQGRSIRVQVNDIGPLVAYLFVPIRKPAKLLKPAEFGKPPKLGKPAEHRMPARLEKPANLATHGGPSGGRTARSAAHSSPR